MGSGCGRTQATLTYARAQRETKGAKQDIITYTHTRTRTRTHRLVAFYDAATHVL